MKSEILRKYNLTTADYVVAQDGSVIVKRTGIKKIRAVEGIEVHYFVSGCGIDWCTVVASGIIINEKSDHKKTVQAIGSATPKNCDFNFIAETAEFRAESRVVLELIGLKEMNVFSEAEYQLNNEIKKSTDDIASKASLLSRVGEFTGYVIKGEHKGLLGEITDSDDEQYIFGEVAVEIGNVVKWSPIDHPYMRDDRSASDIGKITKFLAAKGVTKDTYPELCGKSKVTWVEFISKASLKEIMSVISVAIENK